MPAPCVTLWIGDALGPVERACLRSVLRHGHSVALYCYRTPKGVPDGVEVREASDILPEDSIFLHEAGSVAAFADWFRFELQRRSLGTWIDTDVYLVRPLDADRPYLFGKEDPKLINNAVFRVPHDSELLSALLEVFDMRKVPEWLPFRSYLPARARQIFSGRVDLGRMPFGTTGPDALTAAATRLGLAEEALPIEVFNPVPWQKADWILDPSVSLESVTTQRTVAVHLWNECIKEFKNSPAAKGSFLDRLHREGKD